MWIKKILSKPQKGGFSPTGKNVQIKHDILTVYKTQKEQYV